MKTVTLSDHTADKASAAAAERETEFAVATKAYRAAIASRNKHHQALRDALGLAWLNREVVSTLAALARLAFAYLSAKPQAPVCRSADRDEIVWLKGSEGERKVSTYLAERLSDDWVLVSGYRNAKGEIDQVLVGPRGVFAIEVKFINGVVHCDGDRWWSDRYDRYGNLVETNKPIADKRGRGPSKQLNDSADLLESFLKQRVGGNAVHRAVVLSHESSRLGELSNVAVDAVATIHDLDLERLFARSSWHLDVNATERVLQAIRKDHDFHNGRKGRRESPAAASASGAGGSAGR